MKKDKATPMETIYEQVRGWEKKGRPISDRPSVLKLIPINDRTQEVVAYVLGNPTVFNIPKEMEFIPMDNLDEDDLIRIVATFPTLLSPVDNKEELKKSCVPQERLTRNILVAFELGKRLYDRRRGVRPKILYPDIKDGEIVTIQQIVNNIVERGKRVGDSSKEKLVQLIREETEKFSQETEKGGRITSREIAEAAMDRRIPTSKVSNVQYGMPITRGGGTDRDD